MHIPTTVVTGVIAATTVAPITQSINADIGTNTSGDARELINWMRESKRSAAHSPHDLRAA